jgi:histidine triad (HIT) family protein
MVMNEKDCIFCKVVSGEISHNKIYESENFFAFLDARPAAPGHTLVVPKKHHRWVWDVANISEYFEVVKKIALAQRKAFNVEMIRSVVFGEEVPHAHVSVWPETTGDKMDFSGNREKILQALNS